MGTSGPRDEQHGSVPWSRFAADAPQLADQVRQRFAANLHHVLGTLRPDGAPRLSGTEVTIEADAITLGMMAGSHKLADVRRDPRVELHSAPLEDDLAAGDAKLTGHLVELDGGVPGQPDAGRFELLLTGVSLVQVQGDELVFRTWAPGRGQRERRRR